jgi:hypothetical protein
LLLERSEASLVVVTVVSFCAIADPTPPLSVLMKRILTAHPCHPLAVVAATGGGQSFTSAPHTAEKVATRGAFSEGRSGEPPPTTTTLLQGGGRRHAAEATTRTPTA